MSPSGLRMPGCSNSDEETVRAAPTGEVGHGQAQKWLLHDHDAEHDRQSPPCLGFYAGRVALAAIAYLRLPLRVEVDSDQPIQALIWFCEMAPK